MITEQHKMDLATSLTSRLELLASKKNLPIDADDLVKNLIEAKGLEWFNKMIGMCTNRLYVFKDSDTGKYMLAKKTGI